MHDNNHLFSLLLIFLALLSSCQKAVGPENEDPTVPPIVIEDTTHNGNGTKYTYNFKVRIFEQYKFSNPIDYVWGSSGIANVLEIRAPFDGRKFTVSDSTRKQEFIYGALSEIWEGNNYKETGIKVEWPSNDSIFSVQLKVLGTEFYEEVTSTTKIEHSIYSDNRGLNATVTLHNVDSAAFIIDYPSKFAGSITESILKKVESIEILHPDGNWYTFSNSSKCLDGARSSRGENYFASIILKDLPLDASLKFRINNKNGLNYEFERTIGIVPFVNPYDSVANCYRWDTYLNRIYLSYDEITNEFINATQLPRTENYFTLPIVGDTLKYLHSRYEERLVDYNFYLLPIEIETSPDTTISFERHIFWIPSGFGGERLDSADVDTVSLTIQNRRISSLDIFPEVDTTANGLHTFYPSDSENPHTVKFYIEPDKGTPPFNNTFITLSKEFGIEKITRSIQYSYNSSGALYYRYILIKDE